jgi:iron complex outermembrane receptor protein
MKPFSHFAAVSFMAFLVETPAIAAEPEPIIDDVGIVLTPTRLRQSIADVPGSVTVITADMLSKFGIRSIPEALRLVPGMMVTQISASDYRINYHGTSITAPRRMNVLIDGMSVYRPAFARVEWAALPVSIDDVQRIEVTRGPNSASYGPNSMLAIINVITKHPKAVEGGTLSATGGTRGQAEGLARYAGKIGDSTSYRVSLGQERGDGFENVPGQLGARPGSKDHDAYRVSKLNVRSVTELGAAESIDFQIAALDARNEVQFSDIYQVTHPDLRVKEYALQGVWRKAISEKQEIKAQLYFTQHTNRQEWAECLPTLALLPEMGAMWRANPSYVAAIVAGRMPSGGTATDNALALRALARIRSLGAAALAPTCGNTNQNYRERRGDFEVQDTYVFSDSLRFVSGLGLRRDLAESETYLNGKASNNAWRLFTNIEYKPVADLAINAGGYYEHEALSGASFSPRIALNKHINANNTVRFVLSRANRMPDIVEQRTNWSYRVTGLTPPLLGATEAYFAQSALSPGNLEAERIVSKEIGYTGNFPQHGLMLDAKLFDDRLTRLISGRLTLERYAPSNEGEARLRGAEFQATYEPTDSWMVHLGYSYLDNKSPEPSEQQQYSRNSGSVGVTHSFGDGWRGSLAVYKYQAAELGQSAFGKQEFTLAKTFRLGKDTRVSPSFTATHLDNRTVRSYYDIDRYIENSYAKGMQYRLTVNISY